MYDKNNKKISGSEAFSITRNKIINSIEGTSCCLGLDYRYEAEDSFDFSYDTGGALGGNVVMSSKKIEFIPLGYSKLTSFKPTVSFDAHSKDDTYTFKKDVIGHTTDKKDYVINLALESTKTGRKAANMTGTLSEINEYLEKVGKKITVSKVEKDKKTTYRIILTNIQNDQKTNKSR